MAAVEEFILQYKYVLNMNQEQLGGFGGRNNWQLALLTFTLLFGLNEGTDVCAGAKHWPVSGACSV